MQILCHAPVPVGHRVEVQFFKESRGGPAAPTFRLLEGTPIVTDLDTGIEYASMVHYDHAGRLRDWLGTPFAERLEPQPDVYFAERLTGRVIACRIITDARTPGTTEVMTQLKIEPEAPGEMAPSGAG